MEVAGSGGSQGRGNRAKDAACQGTRETGYEKNVASPSPRVMGLVLMLELIKGLCCRGHWRIASFCAAHCVVGAVGSGWTEDRKWIKRNRKRSDGRFNQRLTLLKRYENKAMLKWKRTESGPVPLQLGDFHST